MILTTRVSSLNFIPPSLSRTSGAGNVYSSRRASLIYYWGGVTLWFFDRGPGTQE